MDFLKKKEDEEKKGLTQWVNLKTSQPNSQSSLGLKFNLHKSYRDVI
jgi:hypothetical protein